MLQSISGLSKALLFIGNKYPNLLGTFALLAFILLSCSNAENDSKDSIATTVTTVPRFTITEIVLNNKLKCLATVEIPEKYSQSDLELVGNATKSQLNCQSTRVRIFIHLPEKDKYGTAWARIDYDPNYKVTFIGTSKETETSAKNVQENNKLFLGQWVDEGCCILRMREDKKDGLLIEEYFPETETVSQFVTLLKKSYRNKKPVFIDKESPKEFYSLSLDGDLLYHIEGEVRVIKKLQ